MTNWNGTILGPPHVGPTRGCQAALSYSALQSVHENRIYSVKIHCGPDYPDKPPEVTFISKVNLPCVDQRNGKVSGSVWLSRCQAYHSIKRST